MRVAFFHSDKPREHLLADAFLEGVKGNGDEIIKRRLQPDTLVEFDYDIACMVGVKSRELFQSHFRGGVHIIYFDKGYTRHAAPGPVHGWEYWRVAVDGHQPTPRLMAVERPSDRWKKLGIKVKPWREAGDHILIAGSSQKYHDFYGLREPTRYWSKIIKHLSSLSERPTRYRPKPSWKAAVPIKGSTFSHASEESIYQALAGAHVLVTHGSNACFEAMIEGVPAIILGEAVARPISSTDLRDVESPRLADMAERMQWFSNLAYCQYTMPEMASGLAWSIIRPQIYG